jgi:hypothetical protein
MMTLAIDPGNTAGVALIGASGELLLEFQMSHDELIEFLVHANPAARLAMRHVDLVVVEDFKLLPGKARAVSQTKTRSLEASKGVGAAELWAAMRGVELIYRDPSHWRIGLQLAGIEPSKWPKQHKDGHSMCAYGAGFHALVELGLVQSRLGTLQ